MTPLTPDRLRAAAAEYRDNEPFFQVESDRLETLPEAFADGTYLWKDIEWIVRWHARRPLDASHQPVESAFRQNDMDGIDHAIATAQAATGPVDGINALLALEGVDVPTGSAILYFMDPERYLPMMQPTWDVLAEADELPHRWPSAVTPSDYASFLAVCERTAAAADLSLVAIERALWQCSGMRD